MCIVNEWLSDHISTSKRLLETTEICLWLGREDLAITQIELLAYYVQQMVLLNCVKE